MQVAAIQSRRMRRKPEESARGLKILQRLGEFELKGPSEPALPLSRVPVLVEAGEDYHFSVMDFVDDAVGEPMKERATRLTEDRGEQMRISAEIGGRLDKGVEELASESLPALLIPTGGLCELCIRLGPDDEAIGHRDRRIRSRDSSKGMASWGFFLWASERRRISRRWSSVRGRDSGSETMLSQIAVASWSRSAMLSRRMSGKDTVAMTGRVHRRTGRDKAAVIPP
jgi:hypothetical protein